MSQKRSIYLLVLSITLLFTYEKVNSQVIDSTFAKAGRHAVYFQSDILSGGISYDFSISNKIAIGLEAVGGVGFRVLLTNPDNYFSCLDDCSKQNSRILTEAFKLKPYLRFFYYKENSIDFGLNYSWIGSLFEFGMLEYKDYLYGLDISAYYGWKKIKFGTGFQFNINTTIYSQNDISSRFVILWTPIKLLILIPKKR